MDKELKRRKMPILARVEKQEEAAAYYPAERINKIREILGIKPDCSNLLANLPFAPGDVTAGAENELQTVVVGSASDVDLPLTIRDSNFFKNIRNSAELDETPKKRISALESYVSGEWGNAWENSWVRFPVSALSPYARLIFDEDLLLDKKKPELGVRSDSGKFFFMEGGELKTRIPVSYMLKLAMADVIDRKPIAHAVIRVMAKAAMSHYSNDNTSPETYSFYPSRLKKTTGHAESLSKETMKRFLLTHLLAVYSNIRFDLEKTGQKSVIYFAPHPPVRQKKLNGLITDSFYRELFMSPCLSGWDRGEDKHRYMALCHQVLSRSQMNAITRLKDAGIINSNLVVLPSMSNISLANNGTHVSLGSLKLTGVCKDETSGFGLRDEKLTGDLSIKIFEHFLPLFTGIYSASPYRMGFDDFHPEKALGFLPHQLSDSHLRMIWKSWKQKAGLKIMGNAVTPFGPSWLDGFLKKAFSLKGDVIPDFRLIDYLCALRSTEESPCLDGSIGNDERLKMDLADLGIFDHRMPMYLPVRQRLFGVMGFSGFEGRYYSLFESLKKDMTDAVNLQTLVTALSYKYILKGEVSHASIPDKPIIESERRQIFFGKAIGLPFFFVKKDTSNFFLMKILGHARKVSQAPKYPGFLKVLQTDYLQALVRLIRHDGADLVEMFGFGGLLDDLKARISDYRGESAAGRLMDGICTDSGFKTPMSVDAETFNIGAESYFRDKLRQKHLDEALDSFEEDLGRLDMWAGFRDMDMHSVLSSITGNKNGVKELFQRLKKNVFDESPEIGAVTKMIHLLLLSIHADKANQAAW